MHKLLIAIPALTLLAGCTLDQFAQVEQDALAAYSKVKAGAQVVSTEIDSAVNGTCLALPAVNGSLQTIISTIPNPGPKTVAAIKKGNAAMVGAAAACDAYAGAPTLAGKVSVFRSLWVAYNAGKAAATAANAAGGA